MAKTGAVHRHHASLCHERKAVYFEHTAYDDTNMYSEVYSCTNTLCDCFPYFVFFPPQHFDVL